MHDPEYFNLTGPFHMSEKPFSSFDDSHVSLLKYQSLSWLLQDDVSYRHRTGEIPTQKQKHTTLYKIHTAKTENSAFEKCSNKFLLNFKLVLM